MLPEICGPLLFIGIPFVAFAQYARILKNADIVWAACTSHDSGNPPLPLSKKIVKFVPMVDVHSTAKTHTISEYLAQEDAAEVRHEFYNGNLTEMAGGILPHNVIKGEFYTLVNLAIRAAKIPHMVLNSDTKVRLEAQNRFVYPDLTITDGQPEYYRSPEGALRRDIITNPLLLVEVLSEDTRAFDKSEKFEAYAAIPGFREYILVEPETIWVKQYFLQDPGNNLWQINTFTDPKARLALQSVNLEISLEELYRVLEKLPKT